MATISAWSMCAELRRRQSPFIPAPPGTTENGNCHDESRGLAGLPKQSAVWLAGRINLLWRHSSRLARFASGRRVAAEFGTVGRAPDRRESGLLATALTRDMRATQVSVLDGRDWDGRSLASPYDMNDLVQAAFARYPYPDVFFGQHRETRSDFFFARTNRLPRWLPDQESDDTFPVKISERQPRRCRCSRGIQRDVTARAQSLDL